ncbi:MAG: hypothetical protein ACRDTI_07280 [Mycobacterium sp.]
MGAPPGTATGTAGIGFTGGGSAVANGAPYNEHIKIVAAQTNFIIRS